MRVCVKSNLLLNSFSTDTTGAQICIAEVEAACPIFVVAGVTFWPDIMAVVESKRVRRF